MLSVCFISKYYKLDRVSFKLNHICQIVDKMIFSRIIDAFAIRRWFIDTR
jgi:hypothetical protein